MDISGGKKEAFKAVIPELKSTIYADTMGEIFKLVPEAIKTSKKYKLGMFSEKYKITKIKGGELITSKKKPLSDAEADKLLKKIRASGIRIPGNDVVKWLRKNR